MNKVLYYLISLYFFIGAILSAYASFFSAIELLSWFATVVSLTFFTINILTIILLFKILTNKNNSIHALNYLLLTQVPSFAVMGIKYVFNCGCYITSGVESPLVFGVAWSIFDVHYCVETGSTQKYFSINIFLILLIYIFNALDEKHKSNKKV